MRARNHVIISAGVSLGFLAVTQSWPATWACFLSGVLIDIDHYLEYYLLRRKFPFRYKDLLDFCDYNHETKVYLFFHAYEYLGVLWLAIFALHLGKVWLGVAIGLTVHLLLDQFSNPVKPLFYFLAYRIRNRFEKPKILSDAYYKRNGHAPSVLT